MKKIILLLAVVLSMTVAAEEYCYDPYGSDVVTEFNAGRTLIQVVWTDEPRGGEASSSWLYDEETDTSICKIWVRIPAQVLGDPDMDALGHEVLHCLIGDFHPEDD